MIKIGRRIKNYGISTLSVHTRAKIAGVPRFCTKQVADANWLLFFNNFFLKTTADLINNAKYIIHKENGGRGICISKRLEKPQLRYRFVVDLNKLCTIIKL